MFTEPFSCANLDGAFGGDSGHTSALPQSLQSVKSCLRLSTLSVRCLIADTHVDHYRAEARRSRPPAVSQRFNLQLTSTGKCLPYPFGV